jgi:CRP-like cAMP-binding protein
VSTSRCHSPISNNSIFGIVVDYVRHAGGDGDWLCIIVSGKVKLGATPRMSGRTNLYAVLGPSDMFGELSVLEPGPRGSTATAVTDVCRARMDRRLVLEWLAAHPEIGRGCCESSRGGRSHRRRSR